MSTRINLQTTFDVCLCVTSYILPVYITNIRCKVTYLNGTSILCYKMFNVDKAHNIKILEDIN